MGGDGMGGEGFIYKHGHTNLFLFSRKRIKNCIRSEYDKLVRSEFSWFNPEQPAENWLLWQPGENSSDRFYSVRFVL